MASASRPSGVSRYSVPSAVCIYTAARMTTVAWLVVFALLGAVGYLCWRAFGKAREREHSEADRLAAFMGVAKTAPASPAAPAAAVAPSNIEMLLFESAGK